MSFLNLIFDYYRGRESGLVSKAKKMLDHLEACADPTRPESLGAVQNLAVLYEASDQLRALRRDVPRLESGNPTALLVLWKIHSGTYPARSLRSEMGSQRPSDNTQKFNLK